MFVFVCDSKFFERELLLRKYSRATDVLLILGSPGKAREAAVARYSTHGGGINACWSQQANSCQARLAILSPPVTLPLHCRSQGLIAFAVRCGPLCCWRGPRARARFQVLPFPRVATVACRSATGMKGRKKGLFRRMHKLQNSYLLFSFRAVKCRHSSLLSRRPKLNCVDTRRELATYKKNIHSECTSFSCTSNPKIIYYLRTGQGAPNNGEKTYGLFVKTGRVLTFIRK